MRRFAFLLVAVAVAGLGIGSALAFGIHSLNSGSGGSPPAVAAAPTTNPTPTPGAATTRDSTSSQAQLPLATPTSTGSAPSSPSGRVPSGMQSGGSMGGRGVTGAIAQVSADGLVVTSRQGQVSVTLGASTVIQKLEAGTRADLKVGAQVTAAGRRQGTGAVGSLIVGARNAVALMGAAGGFGGGGGGGGAGGGMGGGTTGTISRMDGDSITLDTAQGQVTVALATDATIQRVAAAKREDLAVGANIVVSGEPGGDQSSITAASIFLMPVPAR